MDAETLSSVSYGTILIFLVLESTVIVGLFAPGLVAAVGGAYMAGTGSLSPVGVFAAIYLGIFCGDCLGYGFGRFSITSRRIAELLDRLDQKVDISRRRNSFWLVFFQFPVITRAPVPVLLGASRLGVARWLLLDVSATLLFASSVFAVGYFTGRLSGDVGSASRNVAIMQGGFLGLLVVWAAFTGIRMLVRRRRAAAR